MKTKVLFSVLCLGVLMLNANSSKAQYHSSGGGGGGGDDVIWMIDAGVGFGGGVSGGGVISGFSSGGSSYTYSAPPGMYLKVERTKGEHFSYGILFGYQSVKATNTYTESGYNYVYDASTMTYNYVPYSTSYTDTYKLTVISLAARYAYHFSTFDQPFDPYIGAQVGYVMASISYTSTNAGAYGITAAGAGILLGPFGGARYWFSDHIGAWAELGWSLNYGVNIATAGVTFKFGK